MQTDKIKLAKTGIKFLVSRSVSFVVTNGIKANVPVATPLQQAGVVIGSFALSSMVASKAADWADQEFDEVYDSVIAVKSIYDKKKADK